MGNKSNSVKKRSKFNCKRQATKRYGAERSNMNKMKLNKVNNQQLPEKEIDVNNEEILKHETQINNCRLCLQELNSQATEIWGHNLDISEKIFQCCSIRVSRSDSLTFLCMSCVNNLRSIFEFRSMCFKNNEIFMNLYSTTETKYTSHVKIEVNTESTDASLSNNYINQGNNHNPCVENGNTLENYKIVFSSPSIDTNDTEIKEEDATGEDLIKDEIKSSCSADHGTETEDFQNEDFFNGRNCKDATFESTTEVVTPDCTTSKACNDVLITLKVNKKELSCRLCPMICYDKLEYKNHCRSHKKKSISKCTIFGCKKMLNNVTGLTKHLLDEHKNDTSWKYLCNHCGKFFNYSHQLASHNRECHEISGRVECKRCFKLFSSPRQLRRHTVFVHIATGVSCPKCSVSLKNTRSLNRHINQVHLQIEKFCCTHCDKKFSRSSNLQTHMRTHTGELPYACPDCDLRFSHRVTMKHHRLQIHEINMFTKTPADVMTSIKRRNKSKKSK